jgi:phosphoglycerate dehydrogenase-like enzyme
MGWRVLVTARAFWVSGDAARKDLEDAGCVVVDSPKAGPVPGPELIALLQGCQAVVAASDPYDAKVFSACPDLRIVARCGVGIDSVNLADATAAGVVVTNTPGAMTDAVADYTFGLMLSLCRRIVEGDALMRSGGWGEYPGVLVTGKTLGLVGFGQIGQGVARRAVGFGMKILAYDPPMASVVEELAFLSGQPLQVEFVELDDLLERSDFISVHAPNLPETQNLFNAERFARMKPTAYFINTARGGLVDDEALIHALEAGQIAGAAIDVYKQEPLPPDHPLRKAPRCVLTPHNAFNAVEAASEMSRQCAASVIALMNGQRPASICNNDLPEEVWSRP